MLRSRIALMWAAVVVLAAGVTAVADQANQAGQPAVPDAIYKVSTLYNQRFSNAQNENLGTLSDIMINEKGQITYGVLSYGGVAGIGDKLFAVPPDALKTLSDDPQQAGRMRFVLNVTRATFDAQPGFHQQLYPAVPDPIFTKEDRPADQPRQTAATSDERLFRLRALENRPVRNYAGEDLGRVQDFGVHLRESRVVYVSFTFGGVVGIGAKHFAAQWQDVELRSLTGDPADVSLLVHPSRQTLEASPGFDANAFPSEEHMRMFRRQGGTRDGK